MLLGAVSEKTGAQILLLLWRAWHLRNDIIHGKGTCSVVGSARFLISYLESLHIAGNPTQTATYQKGKRKVYEDPSISQSPRGPVQQWAPPPSGWVKINTNESFCAVFGRASARIIVRDDKGLVLLSAWRLLRGCASVEEAEGEACLEGVHQTAEWVRRLARVESDCVALLGALQAKAPNRSSWAGILQDICAAARLLPECKFESIKREANQAAHLLAQLVKRRVEFVVKRFDYPDCIKELVEREAPSRNGASSTSSSNALGPSAPCIDPVS
ncbi:hypothetical protein PR202_gb28926 [Eleusine coracana subsp. coracana]|uniref:RNase H type-1 domain-containing protein n=1 Tax=Eleusine coracana subsp. coracana TaxID=191504 RepID=A0AAV5FYN6_ELECO|nr:hypothetical protein PR202_gb28926 [Eleusine coracana subsp. coracana]